VLGLAVLGVVSERVRTTAEVIALVKCIGGTRFQPTRDVIAGRIAGLAEAGLLVPAAGAGADARWRPSAAGRAHVQRLLMIPGGSPGNALATICACHKICFLDLLEPAARDAVIGDLRAGHRCALHEARAALTGCPCPCSFVKRYLARDVERREAELRWLEALAREVEAARPRRL
jgi:hypothetical protein